MKKNGKVIVLCFAAAILLGLTISVAAILSGDVNGNAERDSNDLAWIRMFYMRQATPTQEQLAACDLNGNGRVDSNDYITMRRYLLGILGAEDYDISKAVIVIRSDASEAVRAHVYGLQQSILEAYGAEIPVVVHGTGRIRRPLEILVGQIDGISLTDCVGQLSGSEYLITALEEGDARRLVLGGTTDYATSAALDRYADALPAGTFTLELGRETRGSSALPNGISGSFLLDADGTFSTIDIERPAANEFDTALIEPILTYKNPVLGLNDKNGWASYGFGDPFVMRYDGSYYLYVSTRDDSAGVKCWKSVDLVNWSYVGLVTEEPITKAAYAPEVIYYNGAFYMYTSPGGGGHRVLRSETPIGPFTLYNDYNLGMSIDGSPFIDNDGTWYFFTAGSDGIHSYKMYAPDGFIDGVSHNELCMGSWTEGPMVVYHDGRYYATYTGNHVLSYAYRINYSVSKQSPISGYVSPKNNPVLISTTDALHGLGHSSTVKAPDLDGYYMAYHSLVGLGGFPKREFHLDRIVFNGDEMRVLGATSAEQQVPSMPDIYHFFDDGFSTDGWTVKGSLTGDGSPTLTAGSAIISDTQLSGNYTAEFHISDIAENGMAGAVFSYLDPDNFGLFLFCPETQTALISFTTDSVSHVTELPLPLSFEEAMRFDCVQSMQVELRNGTYTFYINDRLFTTLDSALPAGAIGYAAFGAEAGFSYIGATCHVGGSSLADRYKTVSDTVGDIPADAYTNEALPTVEKDGVSLICAAENNVLNYRILVAADGNYDCTVRYAADAGDTVLSWYCDGVRIGGMQLASTDGELQSAVLRALPLTSGQHILSCRIDSGSASFLKFELLLHEEVTAASPTADSAVYSDGIWRTNNTSMTADGGWGKRLFGSANWGDYTVEADVTLGDSGDIAILVRATAPGSSQMIHQTTNTEFATDGAEWFLGYAVNLSASGVSLSKNSYGETVEKAVTYAFASGETHRVRVICRGPGILVYVDDVLCLEYNDTDARMQGLVGIRMRNSDGCVSGLTVNP